MFRPPIQLILRVFAAKRYRVYDSTDVDWNLNIAGIRTLQVGQSAETDRFDDTLIVFHRFLGQWDITYYPITTLPSAYYLRHPDDPTGTAILKEGQYLGAYGIAEHHTRTSSHTALCQTAGDVTIYRETAGDGEMYFRNPQTGSFGINIHRGPRNATYSPDNQIYSTGCQIFADQRHFSQFMQTCKFGRTAFSNRFTYTLLHKTDFDIFRTTRRGPLQ